MKGMSMRAAINAKCRDCIYDPYSGLGNWRQQVTACSSSNCPLHPFRPVSKPHKRAGSLNGTGLAQTLISRVLGVEGGQEGLPPAA